MFDVITPFCKTDEDKKTLTTSLKLSFLFITSVYETSCILSQLNKAMYVLVRNESNQSLKTVKVK